MEAMKVVGGGGEVGGHHYGDSEIGRGSGAMALRNDNGSMRARHVIESERWIEMKSARSFDNIDELFALGMSAAKLGDLAEREHVAGPAAEGGCARAGPPGCASRQPSWSKKCAALIALARRAAS